MADINCSFLSDWLTQQEQVASQEFLAHHLIRNLIDPSKFVLRIHLSTYNINSLFLQLAQHQLACFVICRLDQLTCVLIS